MAVTVQDVVNEAPSLAAYAATPEGAAFITSKILLAQDSICASLLGSRYDYAVALLAAHMVLLARANGGAGGVVIGGGAVQSASVDGVSVSYGATTTVRTGGTHGTTGPGAAFDDLMATVNPGFIYL